MSERKIKKHREAPGGSHNLGSVKAPAEAAHPSPSPHSPALPHLHAHDGSETGNTLPAAINPPRLAPPRGAGQEERG